MIELPTGCIAVQRVEEIRVQGQAHMIIDEFLLPALHHGVQRREHIGGEDDRAGVDIDLVLLVDRADAAQRLHGLLLEAAGDVAVLAAQIHAVVLAGFHILLEADGRRALTAVIDLQGGEQQQHIAGEQQHALSDAGGHAGHGDHELVKQRGLAAVGQLVRHGQEQLAQRGILRRALAVAAGVNDENAQAVEACVTLGRFLLFDVADDAQRRAAAAHALPVGVRENRHMGLGREGTLLQLRFKTLRLMRVGRGEDDIIPDRKARIHQRALVVGPGVRIGLGIFLYAFEAAR